MTANPAAQKSFVLDLADGMATVILPDPVDPVQYGPYYTQFILPRGITWSPGPHWHEHYTERLRVLKGKMRVVLDGEAKVVTAEDGEVVVNKGVIHDFMRADFGLPASEQDEDDLVVQEWTDPSDGFKEVFFRQVLSLRFDNKSQFLGTALQAVLTMDYCDNWNVIVPGPLGWYVTHAAYAVVSAVARTFGYRPWYPDIIPQRLHEVARRGGERYARLKTA